jgi:putative transposase
MKTIRVYQLNHLAPKLFHRLKEAQMEAAQVWNRCMEMHKQARLKHTRWPGRNNLQQADVYSCSYTNRRGPSFDLIRD